MTDKNAAIDCCLAREAMQPPTQSRFNRLDGNRAALRGQLRFVGDLKQNSATASAVDLIMCQSNLGQRIYAGYLD